MDTQLKPKVDTKFPVGTSGNPGGRPKGSKNKTTLLREAMQDKADRLLSRDVPDVLRVVIRAAKAGDMAAAKMILDRAVPVRKAADESDTQSGRAPIVIRIENLTSPYPQSKTIEGEVIIEESHDGV